jgi:hypothetical protein
MPLPLKSLSKDGIPRALSKAERYRLLNEPLGAVSICLDILAVEPENQQALVTLVLAMTDEFAHGYKLEDGRPEDVVGRLEGEYERAYYAGIVAERRAEAVLDQNMPGAAHIAHNLLTTAMRQYEQAECLRPPGNDDALLRWNTCVRLMNSRGVQPPADDVGELPLE